MEFVKFIGVLSLVWLFVEGAEPIQFIKAYFEVHIDSKPKHWFKYIIQQLVNCALCSGFWFGLIVYKDVMFAGLSSVASEVFYRLINSFFKRWN